MPIVLIICLCLAAVVGSQAALLLTELKMFSAYRSFHHSTLILEKAEQRWWALYESGEVNNDGRWGFHEGDARYTVRPATADPTYELVTLYAETTNENVVQHHFYVRTEEPEIEVDDS